MKCIMLSMLCLISFNLLHSQEKVQLNVIYQVTHLNDLANRLQPQQAVMVLSVGKRSSRFCTKKKYDEFTTLQRIKKEMAANNDRSGIPVMGMPSASLNELIVKEEIVKNTAELLVVGKIGTKTYYYISTVPKINWILGKEKKNILGFVCQQATGEYGGRNYEVWFTVDLPYSDGPWKLSGLPGLILSASDSKKEIIFEAKEITKDADEDETTASIYRTARAVSVSERDFKKSKESFEKDPESFVLGQAPNRNIIISDIDENGEKRNKIKKYNPIELK